MGEARQYDLHCIICFDLRRRYYIAKIATKKFRDKKKHVSKTKKKQESRTESNEMKSQ